MGRELELGCGNSEVSDQAGQVELEGGCAVYIGEMHQA